ncbi:TPA: hypothetical protein ACXDAY_002332 [Clostridium botulinum]|uniref:hypothetical protein n=1 Tax=Clostridium botulinum TaxID=1491 RepID=UPI000465599B|nr:hypothetical protein [Clostridium botulinum]APR02535.1 hypothetical protein RSJ2_4138 [Clostridium botulinum]AUN01641.1 hypothetical protein RSJ19_01300 [Clostridium botulinum]MBN3359363.1 hypothetical protein [Clostridium botulinum]QDY27210.1 hypothetical protein CGQ40_21125 [Clostridium botulinum]
MLDEILNETEILEEYKQNHLIPEKIKITDIIYLLTKDYCLQNKERKEVYKLIMEDLKKTLGNKFIYTKWNKTVKGIVNRFYRDKSIYKFEVKMNDINEIRISQNELQTIRQLDNLVLEKIAFTMLVYAKISKIQMQRENNDYWVNKSCSVICREAKVGLRGDKQKRIMNELYKREYITTSNINTKINIKLNFGDKENVKNEDDLVITDFDGVVHQYLIWRGEKWKRCLVCDKWIRVKNKERTKYCNKCSKEKRLERQRKYMKNSII